MVHQDQHLKKILFEMVYIQNKIFHLIVCILKIAVDGAMVRQRFSDDREQKRDSSESRRPMRDTRRRQEYMRYLLRRTYGVFFFLSKTASTLEW